MTNPKNHWLYILIAKPALYIKNLLKATVIVGMVSFIMTYAYINSSLHDITLPNSLHTMFGIVIGLLLVFRTNTAYDRWWEARKHIDRLSAITHFFILKLRNSPLTSSKKDGLKEAMLTQIYLIKHFLQCGDSKQSKEIREGIMNGFNALLEKIKIEEVNLLQKDVIRLEQSVSDLVEVFNSLERIKDSPIPISYSLHIKLSVMLYILSLPFGLFASLGLWSTIYVMITYFIIAGIEIISLEIEDPFRGDPNDLPMDEIFGEVKRDVENF